ncbi:MAG: hypothetical protein MPJ78_05240 [Hyphomicrobiaceae bacterium]|nr:hypothetical protein [Hyphomicrobiaceae bacterium]
MRAILYGIALVGVLTVAGCKDTPRPLNYNKGEYGGKADTKLTKEQVETLRQRGKRFAN